MSLGVSGRSSLIVRLPYPFPPLRDRPSGSVTSLRWSLGIDGGEREPGTGYRGGERIERRLSHRIGSLSILLLSPPYSI